MTAARKYPVGVQSFDKLRKDGYLYIDKTPLIYKMITEGCPYFLSRPRRFGKSLLISTLQAVFEGRRELFEAFTTENGIEQPQLFIATTGWQWEKYPIVRFDFSSGDLVTIEQLDTLIDQTLKSYEQQCGITPDVDDANIRMANLMRTLHKQTGKRVVVLVDEYDNFILHSLGDSEKVRQARHRFQNVFGPLKAEDDHLQFAFITGISKFSQMGIFSKLNNLKNISMQAAYECICGISEEELTTKMQVDIERLGTENGLSHDEMLVELKQMYDGYHFSRNMTDVYNPYSLMKVFDSGEITKYWFDSATPSALLDMLRQMPPLSLTDVDGIRLSTYLSIATRHHCPFSTKVAILPSRTISPADKCSPWDFPIKRYEQDSQTVSFRLLPTRSLVILGVTFSLMPITISSKTMTSRNSLRLSNHYMPACPTSGRKTTETSTTTMLFYTHC